MNFDQPKQERNKSLDVTKQEYLSLVNDFGFFITLNASRLDQQIIPGKENELAEMMADLRKPIINGLNYSDFMSQHFNTLTDPVVSKAMLTQLHGFLQYIEPRLAIFKIDSPWVKKFEDIKQKYIAIVTPKN